MWGGHKKRDLCNGKITNLIKLMNAITHIWRASKVLDWLNQTTQNPYMGGFSTSFKLLIMRFMMPTGPFSYAPSHNYYSLANTQVQCQDGIADDLRLILFIGHPADYIHSIPASEWFRFAQFIVAIAIIIVNPRKVHSNSLLLLPVPQASEWVNGG